MDWLRIIPIAAGLGVFWYFFGLLVPVDNRPATPRVKADTGLIALVSSTPAPEYERDFLKPLAAAAAQTEAQLESDCDSQDGRLDGVICVTPTPTPRPTPTPTPTPKPTPTIKPTPAPVAACPANVGAHTDWMAAAGIAASDFGCVNYIASLESGWDPAATSSDGYFGLLQTKRENITPFGDPADPIVQLKWGDFYAHQRYDSWLAAYNHFRRYWSW